MITTDVLIAAALLFFLRVMNNAVSTVRLIMLARQRRALTFVLSVIETLIFAVTIGSVVTDMGNLLNLAAYSVGFAVGGYVGMWIEARLITGHLIVNIFTPKKGHEIAVTLRDQGFGVTETIGEGKDGKVSMLRSVVNKRDMSHLIDIVQGMHEEAFIAVEEARAVERGWVRMRAGRPSATGS
ncbi:MAG: DUF5698 domain-containing protein [Chloroflexota bacterium]|nr:DUF5698 domain-containing protein [Chloroflexota bacterium]